MLNGRRDLPFILSNEYHPKLVSIHAFANPNTIDMLDCLQQPIVRTSMNPSLLAAELPMDFAKFLRELRLMNGQPGYRFVLLCFVVVLERGLRYLAAPIGVFLLLWMSGQLGVFG